MKVAIIAVLAALVIGGGVAVAASSAVPGDALYSFKIHVNEPLRLAFAGSPEAKANVHADLAAERLNEAAILTAEGKSQTGDFSAECAKAGAAFKAHADEAELIAATIASDNPTAARDITTRIETTSSTGSQTFAALADRSNDAMVKAEAKQLADVAASEAADAGTQRAKLDTQLCARPSADVRSQADADINAAANHLVTLQNTLNAQSSQFGEVNSQLSARAQAAANAVADAKAKLAAGASADACLSASAALRAALAAEALANDVLNVAGTLRATSNNANVNATVNGNTNVNGRVNTNVNVKLNANANVNAKVNANTNLNLNLNLNGNANGNANVNALPPLNLNVNVR